MLAFSVKDASALKILYTTDLPLLELTPAPTDGSSPEIAGSKWQVFEMESTASSLFEMVSI